MAWATGVTLTGTGYLPGLNPADTNAELANFLTDWSGDVLAAMRRKAVTEQLPIARKRPLNAGSKNTQFIVTGRSTALFHQRGASVLEDTQSDGSTGFLQNVPSTQVLCNLDRPLSHTTFVDEGDDFMTHWDYQSVESEAAGDAIAQTVDLLRLICIARGAFRVDGGSGKGLTYLSGLKNTTESTLNEGLAGFNTTASVREAEMKRQKTAFDLNHHTGRRFMIVPVATYNQMLLDMTEYIDHDFNAPGNGSLANGVIKKVLDWEVVPATNFPSLPYTAASFRDHKHGGSNDTGNDYEHNATGLQALFCGERVIGCTSLGNSGMRGRFKTIDERIGDMLLTYMWQGNVELQPEFCGAVYSSTVADRNGT